MLPLVDQSYSGIFCFQMYCGSIPRNVVLEYRKLAGLIVNFFPRFEYDDVHKIEEKKADPKIEFRTGIFIRTVLGT